MDQKKEQTQEMARTLCGNYADGICAVDGCICNYNCEYKISANHLYDRGYSKQSNIRNAIEDEVLTLFDKIFALCDNADQKLDILFPPNDEYRKGYANSVKHFRENMEKLKKKYTEGGESDA